MEKVISLDQLIKKNFDKVHKLRNFLTDRLKNRRFD
jgi:hypothetical protein